ncbi:MAG: hypothetical protein KatS3mg087_2195 [Patescibacteria group bacterium]|nr:MAG: hypothetical protein KatS3mg087_2195 [Patescibacteria group bacterium]
MKKKTERKNSRFSPYIFSPNFRLSDCVISCFLETDDSVLRGNINVFRHDNDQFGFVISFSDATDRSSFAMAHATEHTVKSLSCISKPITTLRLTIENQKTVPNFCYDIDSLLNVLRKNTWEGLSTTGTTIRVLPEKETTWSEYDPEKQWTESKKREMFQRVFYYFLK